MTSDRDFRANPQPSEEPGIAPRYRGAFFVTLALAALFALASGVLWWRLHQSMPSARAAAHPSAGGSLKSVPAGETPVSPPSGGGNNEIAGSQPQEPLLSAIQLSPQRMQSIGVQ